MNKRASERADVPNHIELLDQPGCLRVDALQRDQREEQQGREHEHVEE